MSTKGASDSGQGVYRPSDSRTSNRVPDVDDHTHSTPPPYSGPSSHSLPEQSRSFSLPGLPKLNYALYSPPSFQLSSDQTKITTYKAELNVYPAALMSVIQSQSALPPKTEIHIKGFIMNGTPPEFHIKLNMMPLLVGNSDPKQRWNYLKVVNDGELAWRGETKMATEPKLSGGVDEWVRRYCSDSSAIKEFTLERVVSNWDTAYIDGRIRSLIASAGYRGLVEITFPITHSKVVIHSPDKVNRLVTNMTNLFTGTKRYAPVKVIWPYASAPPDSSNRVFAVQSEESWWNDWKGAIRYAVLTKRKGWVTMEDQLELLMAPGSVATTPPEWAS